MRVHGALLFRGDGDAEEQVFGGGAGGAGGEDVNRGVAVFAVSVLGKGSCVESEMASDCTRQK